MTAYKNCHLLKLIRFGFIILYLIHHFHQHYNNKCVYAAFCAPYAGTCLCFSLSQKRCCAIAFIKLLAGLSSIKPASLFLSEA